MIGLFEYLGLLSVKKTKKWIKETRQIQRREKMGDISIRNLPVFHTYSVSLIPPPSTPEFVICCYREDKTLKKSYMKILDIIN